MVVAVLFLLVGFFVGNVFQIGGNVPSPSITGNAVQPTPVPTQQQAPVKVEVDTANEPYLGNANAKVVVVEFSDYQCPFCERAYSDTYPQIKKEYIDTGKIKYVVKDFPLPFHTEADEAAEAAGCAFKQGSDKFWLMHDKLFVAQSAWAGNANPKEIFKTYAKDLGLNTASFNSCLDSGENKQEVQQDISQGSSYGVSGTPTFYINGVGVVGAQPYSVFKQAIDAELA